MMAFFFTMPISRMMPIKRDDVEVGVREQQREQRADAGRGQRGENRDGVDVALVENAEHDVDRHQRGRIRIGSLASEAWKACAVP